MTVNRVSTSIGDTHRTTGCALCDGACSEADLAPLLTAELRWLWDQLAGAADRRGDPYMTEGTLEIRAPRSPEDRHAAVGLVGRKKLAPEQRRRIDLGDLTARVKRRGHRLTPGAVAAHACGRRLAAKAAARADRAAIEQALYGTFEVVWRGLPLVQCTTNSLSAEEAWRRLRSSRWVGRLRAASSPRDVLDQVLSVLAALPSDGSRVDRRHLADELLDDPHGLDDDHPLAGHILGLLTSTGFAPVGRGSRVTWDAVGVDLDDLTGGLLVTGVCPAGWRLPPGAVLTLPPRELANVTWTAPEGDAMIFVTENPSVLGAACDAAANVSSDVRTSAPVRVVCTVGTPSAVEIEALAALAGVGWRVRVRADFDAAGLRHVRALLAGVPGALPWRMGTDDYRRSVELSPAAPRLDLTRVGETPWDTDLASLMREVGVCAYEETITAELVADILGAQSTPGTVDK